MKKRLAAVVAVGLVLFTVGLGFSAPAFAHVRSASGREDYL